MSLLAHNANLPVEPLITLADHEATPCADAACSEDRTYQLCSDAAQPQDCPLVQRSVKLVRTASRLQEQRFPIYYKVMAESHSPHRYRIIGTQRRTITCFLWIPTKTLTAIAAKLVQHQGDDAANADIAHTSIPSYPWNEPALPNAGSGWWAFQLQQGSAAVTSLVAKYFWSDPEDEPVYKWFSQVYTNVIYLGTLFAEGNQTNSTAVVQCVLTTCYPHLDQKRQSLAQAQGNG
jgi:hypothetical protein